MPPVLTLSVERAIANSTRKGGVVLDAFAGSGSTLIAAQKLGRAARLIELEPGYVDMIVRRWQEFTGKVAVLDGDGRTFADVEAERCAAERYDCDLDQMADIGT